MKLSQNEKFEIIRLEEHRTTSVNKTLWELRINKSTYYNWYNAYLADGYDALHKSRSLKSSSGIKSRNLKNNSLQK
ncbi:MAG: hypothetical protein JNK09_00870 [Prolixibacteraceae bacterium]|nr:hypothetical protein [Prolixibacteraceae bacterium]